MTVVAVTGATGFLGQAVLDRALGGGIAVRALARSPQADRFGLTWFPGDLANRKALNRLCRDAEAVIHVAGVVNPADPADFESGNVVGTMNVIEQALATGVPRLIYVSSLAAREPKLSKYGASKARAEHLVKASGLDWTIVRPPTIYGPRDRDLLELFRAAKWGVVPVPRRGRQSVIHADDLARLLLALVPGGEEVTSCSFEPDDGRDGGWRHSELARAIGWAQGRHPHVLKLKSRWLRLAARLDTRLRRSKARLTLDRVGYMTHPDWVVSTSARVPAALWRPHIPTLAGLKATAQWYRAQGWL